MSFRFVGFSALAVFVAAGSAHAQCLPDPAAPGDLVSCAADDADGIDLTGIADIVLDVDSGVTVSNTDDAIRIGENGFVGNEGIIESLDETAIQSAGSIDGDGDPVPAAGLTVDNTGEVVSQGGDAIRGGDDTTVINGPNGFIAADDDAIQTEGFDGLTVINDGIITALDKGIDADDDDGVGGADLVVSNTGSIVTVDEAIEGGDRAEIDNFGAIFSFDDDAIQVADDAEIFNDFDSVIESQGGDAIDIDSGFVDNLGLIITTAEGEAAIDVDAGTDKSLEVLNEGIISGETGILSDVDNTQSQLVFNNGLIEGYGGLAMDLGKGADLVTLFDGSQIIGGADFGSGDDDLVLAGSEFDFDEADIFDGNDGFDIVTFDLAFGAVESLFLRNDIFKISLDGGDGLFSLRLRNWEIFSFSDVELSELELARLAAPTPVPLPAGAVLMLSGLGALGLARRRRRA